MMTKTMVMYKDVGIQWDDFGFWTVQFCGDDLVFNDLSDAYQFIDENF